MPKQSQGKFPTSGSTVLGGLIASVLKTSICDFCSKWKGNPGIASWKAEVLSHLILLFFFLASDQGSNPCPQKNGFLTTSPPGKSLIRLIAWCPLSLLIFLWSYPCQRDYNPWEERPPLTLLCTDHNAWASVVHTVKSATHLWVDHYIFSSWNSAHWGLTHDGKPMDVTFLIQLATFSMWKNSLKRKHLCSYLVFKERRFDYFF